MWSSKNCRFCAAAKTLLESRGYEVEERKIGETHTLIQFTEANPSARLVPQTHIKGKVFNGYDMLREYLLYE